MLWNILLTLNKRPTCNFYMSVFYLLRVHDKMHLTTSISLLRRRVPFVMIQKEPKDHLGEGGFRFPPSPKYPFPLKRPISSSQAPDRSPCPVGQGSFLSLLVLSQRKPLRWASFGAPYLRPPYWMYPRGMHPAPFFRRGAQRAPAKYRAAVIRRGGYYPPTVYQLPCMLHFSGADYLAEAPEQVIEENGSDNV